MFDSDILSMIYLIFEFITKYTRILWLEPSISCVKLRRLKQALGVLLK